MPGKRPLTLPSPPGEGLVFCYLIACKTGPLPQEREEEWRSSRRRRDMTGKRRGRRIPSLLGESHHGGSATRKLIKIATPRFVAGLTGVIPAFREGIFEVGQGEGPLDPESGKTRGFPTWRSERRHVASPTCAPSELFE